MDSKNILRSYFFKEREKKSEDTMTSKDFSVDKLSGSENYHDWVFAIKNLLKFKGLKNCIVQAPPSTTTTNGVTTTNAPKAVETDEEKLDQAESMLSLGVEKNLYVHIRECKGALEIWQTLQRLFEDRGIQRKSSLLRMAMSYKLEDCDNMQTYIEGIMTAKSKLQAIGFQLPDEIVAAIILRGLPNEYKPFMMAIEAGEKEFTAEEVKMKLLDMNVGASNEMECALISKKRFNKKQGKKLKQKKCYICKSTLHLANMCDQKNANEKAESKDKKAGSAHYAFSAFNTIAKQNEWYVDSGASSHMTPFIEILHDKSDASNCSDILSANNEKMSVAATGSTK